MSAGSDQTKTHNTSCSLHFYQFSDSSFYCSQTPDALLKYIQHDIMENFRDAHNVRFANNPVLVILSPLMISM